MRADVPINPRTDLHRVCKDCQASFRLTIGQQEFFRDRNLSLPNRCADCRAARRRAEAYQRGEL